MASAPRVSVIVSTRNPGERIALTVRSILETRGPDFCLHLVDQSDDDRVSGLLGPLLADPRLRYARCARAGLSVGRNAGAAAAASECLAFTDDDCVVTPGWLAEITAPFALDPRIGIVFGTVRPAPYDPAHGFLPAYARREALLARSIFDKHRVEGMGASMAVRRSVWEALHGFDEQLGAGAPMRSAEETDFVMRALLAGFFAYETPQAAVIHSGFRCWPDAPSVVHGYLHGIGAALAKNLKLGHWTVLAVAIRLAVRWAFSRPVVNLGLRAHRRARLAGFLGGVRRGLATPVDRATGHFRRPPDDPAERTPEPGAAGRAVPTTAERRAAVPPPDAVFDGVIADRSPARLDGGSGPGLSDRVSIVMPSWNALPFLQRALASLVANTTYPYELIVVDNGSTDGSAEYIRRFLRDHPEANGTLIEHRENLYFSTACNVGFRSASPDTKYLALYCNDVEAVSAAWLQDLVDAILPNDTIAAGHVGIEPITDRQRGVFSSYDPVYPDPEVKRRLVDLMDRPGAAYPHLYGYCFLLKRALLRHTGLYLHTGPFRQYHSDWELCLRFAVMGYRLAPVRIGVHHWHSISELQEFYPDLYRDLLRRLEDPATRERYLKTGRPFYEAESGFRSRYPTPAARALERLRRRVRGE
jgi:GT2 family glycosyltransferase